MGTWRPFLLTFLASFFSMHSLRSGGEKGRAENGLTQMVITRGSGEEGMGKEEGDY